MKAKVITTVELHNAPAYVKEEEFNEEGATEQQLTAFVLSRILQIYHQNGIMEATGPFEFEAIPMDQIRKIRVKGEPSLIDLSGNVNAAEAEERRKKLADAMMRQPLPINKKPV